MTRKDFWIFSVGCGEQIIGAALSTVIGVMLPMMQMLLHPRLSAFVQGFVGAVGLIGIGVGSFFIGKLADKFGCLRLFRLCPLIILVGAFICLLLNSVPWLIAGMFIAGIGVGGGYSLDSVYISELLPKKLRLLMVGAAKATCSLGFIGAAVACYFIIKADPIPQIWPRMMWVIIVLSGITFLGRLHWAESPKWLLARGRTDEAKKAWQFFFGANVDFSPLLAEAQADAAGPKPGIFSIRKNWDRIIYSGIPWACEGLAVYGFSVFLPVLVMALGIEKAGITGIPRVENSVEITALVNFFILPGFILGLWMLVRGWCRQRMMIWGFVISAIGLGLLLACYLLKWPAWVMIIGFIIFQVALNAGPHIITYIIPAQVYPVEDRGEGSGIASMLGKVGAVLGVLLMPILLHLGGMTLVLIVSGAVMLFGAAISIIYGDRLQKKYGTKL